MNYLKVLPILLLLSSCSRGSTRTVETAWFLALFLFVIISVVGIGVSMVSEVFKKKKPKPVDMDESKAKPVTKKFDINDFSDIKGLDDD